MNGIIGKHIRQNVDFTIVVVGNSGLTYRFESGSSKTIVSNARDPTIEVDMQDVDEMLKMGRSNKSCCGAGPATPLFYFTIQEN